ncbi:MAG: methyl-accepting chemotaxis protein [Rhodospirillaceae bacterium]
MGLLKSLRIGARIAAGYVTVLVLMAVLFVAGYVALTTVASELAEVNRAGAVALAASEAQVELVRLRYDTQVFATSAGDGALAAVRADIERLQQILARLGHAKATGDAGRDLLTFTDLLDRFRAELAPVIGGRQKRERALREEFAMLGPQARAKLLELFEAAAARRDLPAAAALARIEDTWMGARLSIARFIADPDEKGAEQARQRLGDADRGLKAFIAQEPDPRTKQAATEVLSLTGRYADKAAELLPVMLQNQRALTEVLPEIATRFDAALEAFHGRAQQHAGDTEATAQQGIQEAQRFNAATGIAALLLGLALALLIGRSVLRTLGQALDTLNDAARQVATGSNQASVAIGQVSEGARTQMNAVRQIGMAIKQSANAIEDVAGSSGQTYTFTKDAVGMVDNALHNVANLDRLVKTISENSRNISRITAVITRIANQTNMLSLNAAIEAARAGEHGRGFAVVADEVRKLAEEVANSAQEIAEIVETANTEAERGVTVSHAVGTDMGRIGDVFRQIERMASVIASATTQQQASTKEIDATVQSLAQISESNATASEEILATMNELVKIADSARSGAETFKAMM